MSRMLLTCSLLAQRLFSSRPPSFGLTPKELESLRAAWKVVESSPIPVAKIIFKDFFDKKPEYQKKFTKYDQNRPLIHQNEFTSHLRAVVVSLTKIIKEIEDDKEVDRVMNYITSAHRGRAIDRSAMEEMGKSISVSLKVLNRNEYTAGHDVAFDKFWKAFVDDYVARMANAEKTVPPENH